MIVILAETSMLVTVLAFVAEFAIRLICAGVLLMRRRGGHPSTLAWVVVILAVPIVGLILYGIIGQPRFGRRRRQRHAEIVHKVAGTALLFARRFTASREVIDPRYHHIATLAEAISDNPARPGNLVRLLADTDLFIQSLIEDIDAAKRHCHLLFYVYLDDHNGRRVAEALGRAAERGVDCRLLVDDVGSKEFLRSDLCRSVRAGGVQVVAALPANLVRAALSRLDLRNHRKIVVIDGQVGYTGSHNIADAEFLIKKKYGPWVDVSMRIEGPVCHDLQVLFVQDWYMDTDEALTELLNEEPIMHEDGVVAQIAGTGPNAYNEAQHELFQALMHAAREEIIITTPYFVPDEASFIALRTAARRGVRTRLVVPAHNDSWLVAAASRSYYRDLLDAGVEVHEFANGLLHAKTTTIDRSMAVVMTANLDRRSFELNFEVSVAIYDDDIASALRFLQISYIDQSAEVDSLKWRRRSWARKLCQNAAGMFGPLL